MRDFSLADKSDDKKPILTSPKLSIKNGKPRRINQLCIKRGYNS